MTKTKRLIAIALILMMVLALYVPVTAERRIYEVPEPRAELHFIIGSANYVFNGERRASDAPIFLAYGQPMVPLRTIAEAFGVSIEWNGATRSVLITGNGVNASVVINQPLPGGMGTPLIVNSRTFVPLGFVVEVIGAETNWEPGSLSDSFFLTFPENRQGFNSRYIRTIYHHGRVEAAPVTVTSAHELSQFIAAYRSSWHSSVEHDLGLDYPDAFFDENFLVIISVQETSGSTEHRVESVNEKGLIVINRLTPMIGTHDMAQWLIVVELCNDFIPESFSVEFTAIQTFSY
ncbi:MAG: copper amine oxidase N-terminal domain-containing protein [Defluviitaleaceae bacterium]|nr:copper amine oxidase N-terminal domain-containing protein [Defluviitaleaceae bacterium]